MIAITRNPVKDKRKLTIIITGVTRGLGRAMAEGFAKAGYTVLGCGRAKELVEGLLKTFGDPHRFDRVDVASSEEVERWANMLLGKYGAPDLLINNAAIMTKPAPLWTISDDEFSRIVDINLKGTANVIRSFGRAMVANRSGVIVNISSGWGRSTDANVAPYCATKWAIEGLTQALSQELPAGMAAVALSPGIVNTEMLRLCFGRDAHAYEKPEEWAKRAVPFLLTLGPADNGKSLSVPG
jgi:NAD(P)-dependent dehydrogenase (short-subunit alcohol dehydrogenase family)